ncbi:MAG: outer membrane protein assembly factor BamB family protein, partial [Planctomycetota bacterium]
MEIGDRKGPHDGRGDAWVSHTLEEEEIGRPIDLNSALVKVRKNSLGLAYTEILAPAPRTERIYFDGRDRVDLFVNGWWAGGGEGQRDSPLVPDRRVVTVALSKGRNDIVIKVVRRSRDWRFVLRHEGAEPPPNSRNRIALLRALIADFGTDGPATDPADSHIGGGGRFARAIRRGSARFEIARTWAAMGYARRAIEVLGEVARDESVTSEEYGRAYLERVRLFRRLRDAKSAAADLRAFAERLPERSTERFEATLNYLAAELDAGGSFSVDEAIRLYAGSKEGRPKGPGDSESPVDAQRLRRVHAFLAGAYEKRKEEGPRLDHMRRLLFTRGARDPREDALHVEYAEALLAPVREALRHAGTPDGIKKAWPGILERWQFRIGEALDHYRRAGRIALDGPRSGAGRPGAPAAVVASMNEASRAFFDGDYAAALRLLPAAYVRARLWRESEGQPDPWVLDGPRRPVPAGRNWREVDGQLKSRVVRHGPVTGWHVVGPFDNTDWKAYAEDIVPPPPPGSRIDTRRKVRGTQWRIPDRKYYNGHTINLMQLYNKNNVVVYLYKEVKSDREASAVLRMGADDGLTFWFNGKKLHEDRTQRGINPDEISLPVRFRKGTNTLLARVQQGSGDWAFALRIDWRTTAPSDIARLVLLLEHFPGAHRELASVFFEHANNLVGKGHYDKGAALARVVIAAFPDDPERQIQTAMTFMDHGVRDGRDLASAAELGAWALGYIERRALSNKSGYLYEIRRRYWQTLRALGDLKGAVHQLSQIVRSDPGADRVAEASRALAELHRAAGYPEAAARYYRRILDYPGMNDHLLAEARAFDVSFNAATLVRTADRAAARKDIGWAPEYYQRAIDLHSGRLLRSGNDRYVGVVDYCAARIRSLGTEGIAAYRKMVDRRARAMYERALLDRDVVLLQRVASVYPASSVADDALNRAGNLRLEQGRPARAAHIFGRILEEHPDTNIDRAMLLAKYAFASELALDRAGARRAFDLLTRHFGERDLVVSGRTWKASRYAEENLRRIDSADPQRPAGGGGPAAHAPWGPEPGRSSWQVRFPADPTDEAARSRFSASPYRPVMVHGTVAGGALFFHTLEEVFAVDLESARPLWQGRAVPFRLDGGVSLAEDDRAWFSGIPRTQTAVHLGRVYARSLRRARGAVSTSYGTLARSGGAGARVFVVEARDVRLGSPAWSTETDPDLADLTATSPPTALEGAVYAVFQELGPMQSDRGRKRGRNDTGQNQRFHAVSLDAATGKVLWRTPLAAGFAGITMGTERFYLGDHCAAPAAAGGSLYVSTGLGAVASLDAATGDIRWITTYPRARLEKDRSRIEAHMLVHRAPRRPIMTARYLFVAPPDAMTVLCISRASGEILWRKDLTDCHALVGLARADEAIDEATAKPNDAGRGRLVLQGIGLECLDAVTGTRLWRWRPDRKSGPIHGRSALGGPYVYLPTESGLYRLRIGDGGTHSFDPWRALSVDGGPVGNLIVRPDCILGFDSGRLVKISAAPREAAGAGGRKLTSAPAPGKIEITGTARRDISIRSSGLPPAELGPPLVARWHLGGGPATVHRPPPRSSSFGEASSPGREAARDGTGELYIRLGDGLARISPEEQRIVWQSRIVPGVWGLAFTGDMVLAVYRRHIYAFDRATGACLWTRSVLPETSGFTPVDLRDERRNYVVVGATSHGVTVRHADAHYVHVLDPKTGRRILELELREVYHATCLRGELVLVRHEHGKLLVEGRKLPGAFSGAGGAGRKPVAGDVLWHEDLQVRRSGDTGTILSPDGRDLYIYGGGKLARMSLSLREAVFTRPVAALRDVRLRFEGGHLVILGKGGGKEWKSIAVEPETGKVLLEARADDAGKRPEGRAYTYSPGRAVGVFRDDKKKRYSAVCLSVPGGKELWKVALGSHEERMVGGVAAGRYWVQLHARDHGPRPGGGRIRRLLYRLVDVRSGKVVGEGELPGAMHDKHDRRSPW